MPIATGHTYDESAEALRVTDRRGQHLGSAPWEGELMPIGELGSKAIYQVSAERFVGVTPHK
jgi:hypothetical protein